jgi:hypothetical protein
MSARSAHSVLSESKRLAARWVVSLRAVRDVLLALLLATFFCTLVTACSDDSKAPDITTTTTTEQINSAPPAPYAWPQSAPAQTAQVALPPNTIQTPPPASSQLGAAAPASDSLAAPVIHTVD